MQNFDGGEGWTKIGYAIFEKSENFFQKFLIKNFGKNFQEFSKIENFFFFATFFRLRQKNQKIDFFGPKKSFF